MVEGRFRILHITDQHFSNSHFWSPGRLRTDYTQDLAKRIADDHFQELARALDAQKETRPPFDAIVLSGDFTDRHSKEGFEIAALWVKCLVTNGFAPARNMLLVPGNHDVHLGKSIPQSKTALPVPREIAEASYRKFLRELGVGPDGADERLSSSLRIENSTSSEKGLILVGLNSCRTERTDSKGWGYVGLDQLDAILRRILLGEAGYVARDGDILIAFTHHNPLPLWDVELGEINKVSGNRKLSLLMDASALLQALTAFGFGSLLHGHAHIAKTVRLEGYDPRPDKFVRSILVSGQGSFGANLADCKHHHFAVIGIGPVDQSWRDLTLTTAHFFAPRCTNKTKREWTLSKEWGSGWPLSDPGWRSSAVAEMRLLFGDKIISALDKWKLMDSWAPLYYRPDDKEARTTSADWQAALETLTKDVSRALNTQMTVEMVAAAIDDLFENELDWGDVSGTYLSQFLAWKLRKTK